MEKNEYDSASQDQENLRTDAKSQFDVTKTDLTKLSSRFNELPRRNVYAKMMSECQRFSEITTESSSLRNIASVFYTFTSNLNKTIIDTWLKNSEDVVSLEQAMETLKATFQSECYEKSAPKTPSISKSHKVPGSSESHEDFELPDISNTTGGSDSEAENRKNPNKHDEINGRYMKEKVNNPPLKKNWRKNNATTFIAHKTREQRAKRTLRSRVKPPLFRPGNESSPHVKSPYTVKGYACPFCSSIDIQNNSANVRQHIRSKHANEIMPTNEELSKAAASHALSSAHETDEPKSLFPRMVSRSRSLEITPIKFQTRKESRKRPASSPESVLETQTRKKSRFILSRNIITQPNQSNEAYPRSAQHANTKSFEKLDIPLVISMDEVKRINIAVGSAETHGEFNYNNEITLTAQDLESLKDLH